MKESPTDLLPQTAADTKTAKYDSVETSHETSGSRAQRCKILILFR